MKIINPTLLHCTPEVKYCNNHNLYTKFIYLSNSRLVAIPSLLYFYSQNKHNLHFNQLESPLFHRILCCTQCFVQHGYPKQSSLHKSNTHQYQMVRSLEFMSSLPPRYQLAV